MSKWYEVEVELTKVYAVEVGDSEGEDDALDRAVAAMGDFTSATCHGPIANEKDLKTLTTGVDSEVLTLQDRAKPDGPDSQHYRAVLCVIERLMIQGAAEEATGKPEEVGTPDMFLLEVLADAIEAYEQKYWPMEGDDEQE